MRTRLCLAAAALLAVASDARASGNGPYPAGPGSQILPSGGGSVSALIGGGQNTNTIWLSGFAPSQFDHVTVQVYLLFYDNIINSSPVPWDATKKAKVTNWFNNILTTPWGQFLRDYPTSTGWIISSLHVAATYEDAAVEGTSFTCNTSTDACPLAVNAAIAASHLPNDPNGLYFWIPNDEFVTSGSCGGYNTNGALSNGAILACTTQSGQHWLFTKPNTDADSFACFDCSMFIASHELAEALTINVTGPGGLTLSGTQIGDYCNPGIPTGILPFYSNVQPTPGIPNSYYNLAIPDGAGTDYFLAQDIWYNEQGGYCGSSEVTGIQSDNAPCRSGADCPRSGVCAAGHCVVATCSDGIQNHGESDVDCGSVCGENCPNSPVAKKCVTPLDCISGKCTAGLCHSQF